MAYFLKNGSIYIAFVFMIIFIVIVWDYVQGMHTPSESGVIHHQQVNRRRKASISLKAKVFLK